jgi:hypothetical protein
MGFSSMDDFINKTSTLGQTYRADWNKNFLPTTAAVAGEWHCLVNGAGNPGAGTIYNTGTNLAFQATSDSTTGAAGIQHGGNVSTATKHIVNASAFTAATTTAPCVLMLIDLLGFYRVNTTTVITAQTLDNTVTLPRYTTGAGVQAFMFNNNAVALGAATPNLSIGYTNSAGVAARATPTVLPVGKTACPNGQILYSGTGAGKYGPFIPLQGGDGGIRSIQTAQISTSYVSGEFSIGLCKPLLTMPITTLGVASERDLMNQVPSLPRVFDGANLVWLIYSGANTPVNSSIAGHLDLAWGL